MNRLNCNLVFRIHRLVKITDQYHNINTATAAITAAYYILADISVGDGVLRNYEHENLPPPHNGKHWPHHLVWHCKVHLHLFTTVMFSKAHRLKYSVRSAQGLYIYIPLVLTTIWAFNCNKSIYKYNYCKIKMNFI